MEIGVNATPDPAGVLGQSFSSIAVSYTGIPSAGLRVQAHVAGDPETVSYCGYVLTSGSAVALTSLNTACWDGTGNFLSSADLPFIDKVQLAVPSANRAILVSNLCLTGIAFSR
jgi:hypothetical protein